MAREYKHTYEFWKRRFRNINKFAKENGVDNPFGNRVTKRNISEFISHWNALRESGEKSILNAIKYSLIYNTDIKTARAEYNTLKKIYKEQKTEEEYGKFISEKEIVIEDIKKMTTRQFADMHSDEIMDFYRKQKSEGKTGKEAGKIVSTYWFGSN